MVECKLYIRTCLHHSLLNLLILVASEAVCCKHHHNITTQSWTIISFCWSDISCSLHCEDPEQTVLHSHFPSPPSLHCSSSHSASVSPFRSQGCLASLYRKAVLHWPSLLSSCSVSNSDTTFSGIAVTLLTFSRWDIDKHANSTSF